MSTRTDYSVAGGGGRGYINVGGWNSTLTDRTTTQMEVPGITRREGANVYMYALQGNASASGSGVYLVRCAPLTDGGTTGNISPIVMTTLGAGTANSQALHAIAIQTCDSNTYGWYFVEGVTTIQIGTATTSATVATPITVAAASVNKMVGGAALGIGIALTGIACDISGQAWVSLRGKVRGGVF